MTTSIAAQLVASAADPITALLTRDWAAFGGWSLFIGLGLFLLLSLVRETLVPGARYRRMEEASVKLADVNAKQTEQIGQLVTANEITKHFFEETVPKRGEPKT